ncbi:syntaxin-4-like [Lucilia sericata]|uniref:syntaxin-4-like n=1 Tax=Lucilia sericata TaxID=13632 RepID=UPI0018A82304|nr:syntaxin-4-like [Lucilia sericata]
MIRDRLSELKEVMCSIHDPSEFLVIIENDETDECYEREHSPAMDGLFKMYNKIPNEFDLILTNIDTMKIMSQAKNSKNFDDKEFYKVRLNTLQIGNKLMNKFQSIRKNLPEENDYSTMARMQRSLYYGFFENYVKIWTKNDQSFMNIGTLVNYDLTEEEIDTLIAHRVTTLYDANVS